MYIKETQEVGIEEKDRDSTLTTELYLLRNQSKTQDKNPQFLTSKNKIMFFIVCYRASKKVFR